MSCAGVEQIQLLWLCPLPVAGVPEKTAQFCDPAQLSALQERLAQQQQHTAHSSHHQQQQWHEQQPQQQQMQSPPDGTPGMDWSGGDAAPMSTSPGEDNRCAC